MLLMLKSWAAWLDHCYRETKVLAWYVFKSGISWLFYDQEQYIYSIELEIWEGWLSSSWYTLYGHYELALQQVYEQSNMLQ